MTDQTPAFGVDVEDNDAAITDTITGQYALEGAALDANPRALPAMLARAYQLVRKDILDEMLVKNLEPGPSYRVTVVVEVDTKEVVVIDSTGSRA